MTHFAGPFDNTEVAIGREPGPGLRTQQGRFLFAGEPVHLLGAGTLSLARAGGCPGDDLDAWRGYLRLLSARQSPHTLFRVRINLWGFAAPGASGAAPYVPAADGWNLEAFDPDYWGLLRQVVQEARRAGVLVEVVLLDAASLLGADGAGVWRRHPWNAANGGPIAGRPIPALYSLASPRDLRLCDAPDPGEPGARALQRHVQRLVRQAVRTLDGLHNVSWEIVHGIDGCDPVRCGFVEHLVAFLWEHDGDDRSATCSGCQPLRGDPAYYRMRGIDTAQFLLDPRGLDPHSGVAEVIRRVRAYGKPAVCAGVLGAPGGDAAERRRFWQAALAGGAMTAAGPSTMGDTTALRWLGALARIAEDARLTVMREAVDLARCEETDVFALGGIGPQDGLVYLSSERPVAATRVLLRLPAGAWRLRWLDPRTAESAGPGPASVLTGDAVVETPPFEEDLVGHLRRGAEGGGA